MLTADEHTQSARARAAGHTYATVTPGALFGSQSDSRLAAEVRRINPERYRELRAAHDIEIGVSPRPMPEIAED